MKKRIIESMSMEEAFRALNSRKSEKMTMKEGWEAEAPESYSGDELRQAVAEEMEFMLDKLGENVTLDAAYEYFMELCAEARITFDREELEAILRDEYGITESLNSKKSLNANIGKQLTEAVSKNSLIKWLKNHADQDVSAEDFNTLVDNLWSVIEKENAERKYYGMGYKSIEEVDVPQLIDSSDNPVHDIGYRLLGWIYDDDIDENLNESDDDNDFEDNIDEITTDNFTTIAEIVPFDDFIRGKTAIYFLKDFAGYTAELYIGVYDGAIYGVDPANETADYICEISDITSYEDLSLKANFDSDNDFYGEEAVLINEFNYDDLTWAEFIQKYEVDEI